MAFRNEGDIQKFTVSELCSSERDTRSDSISIIISDKRITPQQNVRLELVDYLKKILPNLEVYGRGFNPISDKAEVMLKNKYHLVIENSTYSGYWTEKLVDPILCGNQIFYVGDPDVSKIFPSVIQLSLNRFDECANLIQMHIKQDLYMENQALRDADLNTYLSKENLLCVLEKWALSSKYPKYAEMSISILKPGMRPMKSYVSRVMRLIRRLFFMAEV